MGDFLFVLSLASLCASIVLAVIFIVNIFRKKPKKKFFLSAIACFVAFIVLAIAGAQVDYNNMTPEEREEYDSRVAAESESREAAEAAEEESKKAEEESKKQAKKEEESRKQAQKDAEKTTEKKVETTQKDLQKIAEDYKKSCAEVSYNDVERNPNKYDGTKIKITGKVVQVSEGVLFDSNTYLVSVTCDEYGFWDDNVYISYEPPENESRVLEDDIVTFYGECTGVTTYVSVLGAKITIPSLSAKYVEIQQ